MSVLVVVDNRVTLDAVDLPDKKTVEVKITAADCEILGSEFLGVAMLRKLHLPDFKAKSKPQGMRSQ